MNIYLIYFHFHFYSVFNSKHLLKHINRSKLIISRNQRWWEQSIIQFQMHFSEKKPIKTVNGNSYQQHWWLKNKTEKTFSLKGCAMKDNSNRLMTSWWLPMTVCDCLMTAWWLPNNWLWLPDDCVWLLDDFWWLSVPAWWLFDNCLTPT